LNLVDSVFVIFNYLCTLKRRRKKVNYAVEFDIILVFRASFKKKEKKRKENALSRMVDGGIGGS